MSNNVRLVDFSIDLPVQLMEATQESNGLRRIAGVFAQGGIKNRNNRIYPTEVYKEWVSQVRPLVQRGAFTGELDHPDLPQGSLERTAIRFTKLEMDNDMGRFEALILNTEAGKNLLALAEGGVEIGMSTRAVAPVKVEEIDGELTTIVQLGGSLYGIDAVKVPSNPAGFAKIQESLEEAFEENLKAQEDTIMTLEELKKAHPELVAQLVSETQAPLNAQISELSGKLEEATKEKEAADTAKNDADEKAKTAETTLAKVTESLRASGVIKDTESLNESVKQPAQPTEVQKLIQEKEELAGELGKAVKRLDEMERTEKLNKHFEKAVKDHKFETILREGIEPSKFDTTEQLDTEISRLTKVAESAAKGAETPAGKGILNESVDAKDEEKQRWAKLAGL